MGTETEQWVPKGVYLIVVNRGNMQCIFPLTTKDLVDINGAQMAMMAAKQFAHLQAGEPRDKPSMPISPTSRQQLALTWLNGDYLRADGPLYGQCEGKWDDMEVPEGFRNKYHGSAPFVEMNLVDTPIIIR